jgi:hypothetical protein
MCREPDQKIVTTDASDRRDAKVVLSNVDTICPRRECDIHAIVDEERYPTLAADLCYLSSVTRDLSI